MFSRVVVFAAATMAAFVAAVPTGGDGPSVNCTTGPVQCCGQVNPSTLLNLIPYSLLLGSVVVPLGTAIGFTCSPLTLIGVGGSTCQGQTVCCQNNSFNGVIAIGCSPINLNL